MFKISILVKLIYGWLKEVFFDDPTSSDFRSHKYDTMRAIGVMFIMLCIIVDTILIFLLSLHCTR